MSDCYNDSGPCGALIVFVISGIGARKQEIKGSPCSPSSAPMGLPLKLQISVSLWKKNKSTWKNGNSSDD